MATTGSQYGVNQSAPNDIWTPWEVVNNTGPPPPPPPPNGALAEFIMMMSSPATSCPVTIDDWLNSANPTFNGKLGGTKMFYYPTDTLPAAFSTGHRSNDNESKMPPGTMTIVSYWNETTNVASYVDSIPDDRQVIMVYAQEAEDHTDVFATPADFVSRFINQASIIRSAIAGRPNIFVAMDSAGSQYANKNSTASTGQWVVPAEHLDLYLVDSYQNTNPIPAGGLASLAGYQGWLGVYAGLGRQLGFGEYGIPACSGDVARNNRLCLDAHYLRSIFTPGAPGAVSPFPLKTWNYWWSNCSAGGLQTSCTRQHKFLDAACIQTWNTILAGNDSTLPAGS